MNRGDQPAFPDPMRGAEQSILNQSPHQLPDGQTIRELFAKDILCAHGQRLLFRENN